MDFGYDLDGRHTTREDSKSDRGSCRRRPGASLEAQTDGNNGIDNNFGAHLVPALFDTQHFFGEDPFFEDQANDNLQSGRLTFLLRVDEVPADLADSARAPGALYMAGPIAGGKPTFGTTDHWPVLSSSLADGATISRPTVTFPDGYIVRGSWYSGPGRATFEMDAHWRYRLAVPIEDAMIGVSLGDGRDGVIAGKIAVDKATEALGRYASTLGICPSVEPPNSANAFRMITSIAELAADLRLRDNDTTAVCDAVSLGLGFTMSPTGEPVEVVAPFPPPPDQCVDGGSAPDAGVDATSDANESG